MAAHCYEIELLFKPLQPTWKHSMECAWLCAVVILLMSLCYYYVTSMTREMVEQQQEKKLVFLMTASILSFSFGTLEPFFPNFGGSPILTNWVAINDWPCMPA